ncbi:MAG: hypothetical protein ABIH99_04750 [Candidatus Micrarchaeota archaeon]
MASKTNSELIQLLSSFGDKSRNAARELGRRNAKEYIPELRARLEKTDDFLEEIGIILALGELDAREAVSDIELYIYCDYASWAAAEALGKLEAFHLIPEYLEAFEYADPLDKHTRASALYALAHLNARQIIPKLMQILSNEKEDRYIQNVAGNALEIMKATERIPELMEKLEKAKTPNAQISLIYTLGRLEAKEAGPLILSKLNLLDRRIVNSFSWDQTGTKAVCEAALQALRQIKLYSAIPTLRALEKGMDDDIPNIAGYALDELRTDFNALTEELRFNPYSDQRFEIIRYLREATSKEEAFKVSQLLISLLKTEKHEGVIPTLIDAIEHISEKSMNE